MTGFDLAAAIPFVADAGAKTGLHAAYVRRLLSAIVADHTLLDPLVVEIFSPVAREQIDRIRDSVLAFGGSEEDVQALIARYGQGLVLGTTEGRPS